LLNATHQPLAEDEGSVVKINMLLHKLPRVKAAGISPAEAFAGTFHINQRYSQMQTSYKQAAAGQLPDALPAEIYCHTLTDTSILSPELAGRGYHTLTLFGLDVPYALFERDAEATKQAAVRRYLHGLNEFLEEPIEECMAADARGNPCIEAKSPVDIERELQMPRGNIFHNALSWFFAQTPGEIGSWGVETEHHRVYICGSGARRGGAVSGIPGHNAAMRVLSDEGLLG
jgi:phytoene dehydrogenase-like protein